mmetsp:Transcript_2467/g.4143  ORF Transcript_2467/g.4143 Transcript_2467/m.4143 type:complete len:106 (-) Transcript_2467:96-413(-)
MSVDGHINAELLGEREATKHQCLMEGLQDGFFSGIKASIVSGGLFWATWKYSPFFRNRFSVSARTALLVMPIFYTAQLKLDLSMHKCLQTRLTADYVVLRDADGN